MFKNVKYSLTSLLGKSYVEGVARANEFFGKMSYDEAMAIANEEVISRQLAELNGRRFCFGGVVISDKYLVYAARIDGQGNAFFGKLCAERGCRV